MVRWREGTVLDRIAICSNAEEVNGTEVNSRAKKSIGDDGRRIAMVMNSVAMELHGIDG